MHDLAEQALYQTIYKIEKFNCITLDSSGFKWNPVESTGIHWHRFLL